MTNLRRYGVGGILLMALILVAGCNFFSPKERVPEPPAPPIDPASIIFSDDFSEQVEGDNGDDLIQWHMHVGNPENIEVVVDVDDEVSSGQAINLKTTTGSTRTRIASIPWDERLADASKIGIEYKIKMVPGSYTANVELLKTSSTTFISIHHPSQGTGMTTRGATVGKLKEGEWNHIRAIIDLEKNEYEVYLNNMNQKVTAPETNSNEKYRQGLFDFRETLESWTDTELFHIGLDQEGTGQRLSEGYYSDINVWIIE